MISHAHKCIFVHQRKCAGSSIITAFGFRKGSEAWSFGNDGVLAPEWHQHKNIVEQYFKFAVVRNPRDRFVSGWKYLPATRRRSLLDVLQDLPAAGHDYRHLTRPQYVTLYDDAGQLAVDQLLRYENLEAEFRGVCEKIGLQTQLPWVNARKNPYSIRGISRRLAIDWVSDRGRAGASPIRGNLTGLTSTINRENCSRKTLPRISNASATNFN